MDSEEERGQVMMVVMIVFVWLSLWPCSIAGKHQLWETQFVGVCWHTKCAPFPTSDPDSGLCAAARFIRTRAAILIYAAVFIVLYVALAPLTLCAAVCMESSQRSAYAAMQAEGDEPDLAHEADIEANTVQGHDLRRLLSVEWTPPAGEASSNLKPIGDGDLIVGENYE